MLIVTQLKSPRANGVTSEIRLFHSNMTEQFYQLTLSEAIALHKCGLIQTPALLYFLLRTRLAPGWKMTLHQQEISQHLGISRTAFYKAIQKLKDKGLIDWEAPNGLVVTVAESTTQSQKVQLSSKKCDSVAESATPVAESATPVAESATTPPSKPAPEKASSASPDSYQIFIKSLSDYAREKFFNFVREKTANFPQPINDVEAWLAGTNGAGQKRFRVYYAMFQDVVGEGVAPSQDWEAHPQRDEWIAEIQQGGKPRFVAQGGPRSEWESRQAFADWAISHNLLWRNKG